MPAKKRILTAAEQLFTTKGYDNVTVREIAAAADTSHTSIYVYYKNKRQLLASLATPPLEQLLDELKRKSSVLEMAVHYVKFGLAHRPVYELYMIHHATRVDEKSEDELNQLRISLFDLLKSAISKAIERDEEALPFARMLFYQLHGTIMSYVHSTERTDAIEARVLPLVERAVEKLLRGDA